MYRAKVSPQGQLTLPKKARQNLGVVDGVSYVYVTVLDEHTIGVSTENPISKYYGSCKPKPGKPSMVDVLAELEREDNAKFDARGW